MKTQIQSNFIKLELSSVKVRYKYYLIVILFYFTLINYCISQTEPDPCETEFPISDRCQVFGEPNFINTESLCEIYNGFNPDYTFTDGTRASSLPYSLWPGASSTFNNVEILIQGNFYVDIPVSFWNCTVKLSPGAQIIVAPKIGRSQMLAYKTNFYSCETMWQGIVVSSGSRCIMYLCHIEDAQYALTIHSNVSLTLLGNTFNRNFVGITNATSTTTLTALQFKGNIFTCTSQLNEYFNLPYSSASYPLSYTGFLLNHCSTSIGSYGSNNTFKNISFGIVSFNSDVDIKGCIFIDTQPNRFIWPTYISSKYGAAIYAVNSTISVIGTSLNLGSSFKNTHIISKESNLHFIHNYFEDCEIAAEKSTNGQTIQFENNQFNDYVAFHNGMGTLFWTLNIQRSAASGSNAHTIIKNNKFNFVGPREDLDFVGILGLTGLLDPTDYAFISNNTITVSEVCKLECLRLIPSLSENNLVTNNIIKFDANYNNLIGISCLSFGSEGLTTNNAFIGNNISSNSYDEDLLSMGIYAFSTEGPKFCNNTTNNLTYGMVVSGNCNKIEIRENQFENHKTGFWLRNSTAPDLYGNGIIGAQVAPDNTWLDNTPIKYSEDAARYSSTQDYSFSPYYIPIAHDNIDIYDPINKTPVSGWFFPKDVEGPECNAINEPIVNKFDSLIIMNYSGYSSLPAAHKFSLLKQLLTTLIEDSALTTTYSSFINANKVQPAYKIATARVQIKNVLQMDINDQSTLDSINNVILANKNTLLTIQGRNNDNLDTINFLEPSGLDTILNVLSTNNGNRLNGDIIRNSRTVSLNIKLDSIYNYLDTISVSKDYEEAFRTIYMLFIKEIITGELDETDQEAIIDIAANSLDSTGAASLAISLFNPCLDSELSYMSPVNRDVASIAEDNSVYYQLQTSSLVDSINYSNDINLEYLLFNNENYVFQLYDLAGKLLISENIDVNIQQIGSNYNLMPGLYIYAIFDKTSNRIINSGKKIIMD